MIKSVEMVNWRAYDKREIHFEPGITFLMGSNGTGKTSVLEAICYGLTGEAAMFTSKTRPKLLRDPEKSATVNIVFEADGKQYHIRRTQSPKSAADAELKRMIDGKVLATNHSSSTRQISKLMGVSDDFLRRITYMAEGDVFRFLNDPPGEALDIQIRQVLGLTQLDEFTSAVDKAEKQLKQRMDALQELMNDLNRLNIRTEIDLQNHLTSGEREREKLLEEIEANKAKFIHIENLTQEAAKFQKLVSYILTESSRSPELWKNFQSTPLLEYYYRLEQEFELIRMKNQDLAVQIARLEGEQQAGKRILSVLEPYENRLETLPCPVCRKPMAEHERQSILEDIRKDLQSSSKQAVMLHDNQQKYDLLQKELKKKIEVLQELRNLLAHGRIVELKADSTFDQITSTVSQSMEKQKHEVFLQSQRHEIQDHIRNLQTQQAEFLAIQKRINELGFDRPEEVSEALVNLEVRLLSLRAAAEASKQTLITQRNTDMQCIYNQIAQLWGTFTGENEWQITLDGKGMPTLQNDIGRQFDLYQLSGGEKTALLIMLHTIIAHNFSRSDFIMIDEPLEHLDPVNRRSLIRFLVQSYRRGMFKQAVVATFEESLIRKYLSEDGVKVVMI